MSKSNTIQKFKVKVSDERYIKTSRREGVKNLFDAITEILTNSGDSYFRLWRKNKSSEQYGRILIEYYRSNKKPYLRITDNAEGMDRDALLRNFSNYRERLSHKNDRSFFGKGAKDCTSLGNIQVESICDNQYNKIDVDQKLNGIQDKTRSASQSVRKKLRLKKNGTVFTLFINTDVKLPVIDSFVKNLQWHFGINKYIHEESKGSKVILLDANKNEQHSIIYREPGESEIVLDEKIHIENYPDAKAHLIIKKSIKPLEHSDKPFARHGILVQSDTGTGSYERTILDESLREDPLIYNFYGYLKTDYISDLMEDFDERTLNDKKYSEKNPFLILDENRMNGLNKTHPFTKKLFKQPLTRLKQLIAEEKVKLRKEKDKIENNETKKLLNAMEKISDAFIKDEADLDEASDSGSSDRFKKKGCIVVPPFLYLLKDEEKTIGFYIKENNLKKNNYTCEIKVSRGANTIEIDENKVELTKSDKEEDVYFCKFKIKGLSNFNNGEIQFFNGNQLKTSINFTVKEDLERKFTNDLEFERKNYSVKANKKKIIRILAKTPDFLDKEMDIVIRNSDHSNVAILGSNTVTFKKVNNSNYYAAEIQIQGRRVNSSSEFTAELFGITASTKISVVEKEKTDGIKIEIRPEDYGNYRAIWDLEKKNLLKISAKHQQLKKILGNEDEDYPGQNSLQFRLILVEILADIMSWKKLSLSTRKEPHLYKSWQDQNDIQILADDVRGKYNVFRNQALLNFLPLIGTLDQK